MKWPLATLKVSGQKMIYEGLYPFRYPLHMLQCNGFTDVIVIVQVKIMILLCHLLLGQSTHHELLKFT